MNMCHPERLPCLIRNDRANITADCREAFGRLDDNARRHILNEPLEEVVRVLEQNLLSKFRARMILEAGALTNECSCMNSIPKYPTLKDVWLEKHGDSATEVMTAIHTACERGAPKVSNLFFSLYTKNRRRGKESDGKFVYSALTGPCSIAMCERVALGDAGMSVQGRYSSIILQNSSLRAVAHLEDTPRSVMGLKQRGAEQGQISERGDAPIMVDSTIFYSQHACRRTDCQNRDVTYQAFYSKHPTVNNPIIATYTALHHTSGSWHAVTLLEIPGVPTSLENQRTTRKIMINTTLSICITPMILQMLNCLTAAVV